MPTTYERFWAQVDRSGGPGRCWPWTGGRSPRGDPVFEVRRARTTARRYAYRMEYGDPGKLRVTVTCGLPDCCNPRHLSIATSRAVVLGNGSAGARNAARTHCSRGHELVAANRYQRADGRTECRLCKKRRAMKRINENETE